MLCLAFLQGSTKIGESNMKKAITTSVALLAVATLGLTACGGDATGDGSKSPDATSNSSASDTSAPKEPVELEYMHRLPDKEGMTTVQEIVKRWNDEHPNIQVKPTKWDGEANELITKLEQDVQAGNAACLAQVGYGEVPELFVKGLFEDVTSEVEKYKEPFAEGAVSLMTVGDVGVGLPQDVGPLIYMYNEAEFKKLGLEVPTTLDEFKKTAAKAAESGKYIAAYTPDEAGYWLSGQAAAAGAKWYSAENDQWVVNANDDKTKVVADFWQEMLDAKSVLVTPRWNESFDKAQTDGKLIGHIAAAWEVGFVLDVLDGTAYEGQWRVAQLPDFGAGAMSGPDGGSGVAVMKGCKHPAEAMEFNAWFNTQIEDLATQGLVVATKDAPKNPEKWLRQFGDQDVQSELAKAASAMNPEFVYAPGFSSVVTPMVEAATKAGSGEGKVADVFTAAQEASVKTLTDAGLPVADN